MQFVAVTGLKEAASFFFFKQAAKPKQCGCEVHEQQRNTLEVEWSAYLGRGVAPGSPASGREGTNSPPDFTTQEEGVGAKMGSVH